MFVLQIISIIDPNTKSNIFDVICVLICLFVILTKINHIFIKTCIMYPYATKITLITLTIDFIGLLARITWISHINVICNTNTDTTVTDNDADHNQSSTYLFFFNDVFTYYFDKYINLDSIYDINYVTYYYLQSWKICLHVWIVICQVMILPSLSAIISHIFWRCRGYHNHYDHLYISQFFPYLRYAGIYLVVILFMHASLIPLSLIFVFGHSHSHMYKTRVNNAMYYKLVFDFYIKHSNNLSELNDKICLMHWRAANIINNRSKLMLQGIRSYERISTISQINENELTMVNIYKCLYGDDHYIVFWHRKFEQLQSLRKKCGKRSICVVFKQFCDSSIHFLFGVAIIFRKILTVCPTHVWSLCCCIRIIASTDNIKYGLLKLFHFIEFIGSQQMRQNIKIIVNFFSHEWFVQFRHSRCRYFAKRLISFTFDVMFHTSRSIVLFVGFIHYIFIAGCSLFCLFCAIWLPIMFFINYCLNYNDDMNMLVFLSLILSLIYIICICWVISYTYKIFLAIYVYIHWYCFYERIWDDFYLYLGPKIPPIFVSNVINTYNCTLKRNEIVKDSLLGPDLASIVLHYLPKHCILITDEKKLQNVNQQTK